ncbi:MAG TPA: hypothetical protein PKK43_11415, partial [Spirochaetota bacterium]|nr:hypothetical protein [Spirochaetota bacterium]
LPEDALVALSEEVEVPEDVSAVSENPSEENLTDELAEIPGDFILTPVDLSEAEKIAREDILILNEDDLIEELESSDSDHRKSGETSGTRVPEIERKVQYVHPASSVMDNSHRESIENDIIAPESLVIEEDGAEIKKRYEQSALKEESEDLVDITASVVILDDEEDVDRLSMSIPEDKREDMKKLLGYLDGLFEKLPDEVVKNFANSEYFDLYVKIMNDLGDK